LDENGKFPVLGTGGVTGKTRTHMHNGPAVIIGRKGTIDKPYYAGEPFWAIDTTFFCLPKQRCDTKWVFYLMNSINLKKYNEASGVPSLSRETIYGILVLAPHKKEQEKIAATLTSYDSEISSLKSKLHHLRQEKKALMQQLLTGKRCVKINREAA
jgi:type I restriction enzyme S subunit